MRLLVFVTLFGVLLDAGDALQIQCYQCEEMKHNDCSTPEYIVNCTVNVQDMCQKEVLVKPDGIHYRKSCASSGACLIASSGYQQFCTGKLNSVCISCCNTPLCNGPKRKRPAPSAATSNPRMNRLLLFFLTLFPPLLTLLPLTLILESRLGITAVPKEQIWILRWLCNLSASRKTVDLIDITLKPLRMTRENCELEEY
ncbi:ly6/PLAUR domain-containing protein 1-like [Scomber scombrus]|uniref:ly6/PLAUR domain-containing protein 1-like n=1 Tax=Scomber scombrus TaxID=13677 RepID=UPI002DD7D241|nr:ly6/PLAUR domain-containing protein 1-like [Scomber scombrus]